MSKPYRHQLLKSTSSGFTAICPEYGAHHATRTFFIVQAYGKSTEDMIDWQKRMERILAPLSRLAFDRVETLFLIPAEKDENFALHDAAGAMTIRKKPVIPISVIQPEDNADQPWTRLLNAGIAYANRRSGNPAEIRIMPISFETDLDEENVEILSACIATETGFVSQRSIPENIAEIPKFQSGATLALQFKESLEMGTMPQHYRFLQLASCHRNTLASWPIRVFQKIGMFNPACNLLGGMEDIELLLRAMIDGSINYRPTGTTIFYDDIRIRQLEGLPENNERVIAQKKKLDNEVLTLKAIWHWLETEWVIRKSNELMGRPDYGAEFNLRATLEHAYG